jgi:hypothetical protein
MVEVFKTNIYSSCLAEFAIHLLNINFPDYQVNFDLDDCDRIMRVKSDAASININSVIQVLNDIHVKAEVLPDDLNDFPSVTDVIFNLKTKSN